MIFGPKLNAQCPQKILKDIENEKKDHKPECPKNLGRETVLGCFEEPAYSSGSECQFSGVV